MAELSFEGVTILGMSGAVPVNKIINRNFTRHFDQETVNDIIDKTGVEERRISNDKTTSSDLCYAAAEKLINDLKIDRSDISVLLLFVSQTPDYRMPAN